MKALLSKLSNSSMIQARLATFFYSICGKEWLRNWPKATRQIKDNTESRQSGSRAYSLEHYAIVYSLSLQIARPDTASMAISQ